VPLVYNPKDGYDEDERIAVFKLVTTFWADYVSDCQESDTRPTAVDFAVWLIHVKGFRDGVDFARDDTEEEQSP
jgi:hypothetical protein